MRRDDPNLPDLRRIAQALDDLCEQVVFVGGAVAGLLVTDPLGTSVRATRDVDAVVNTSRARFHEIEALVAERGFERDVRSDVICRWVHSASGVAFDLMPVQAEVLGFTNRWYPFAVETAEQMHLGNGITIRLVSAVAFVATKLEAFASRGHGDFLSSHDLEDVLNIIDGREELIGEMANAPNDVRQAVAEAFRLLLANADFANVFPGLMAEPARAPLLWARMKMLRDAKAPQGSLFAGYEP